MAALLLAGGVLVTVSVVSDPGASSAGVAQGWLDESGQWPMVGELVSMDYLVRVYASDEGTLYTVCEPDGRVIRAGLRGDEVAAAFEGLDLPSSWNEGSDQGWDERWDRGDGYLLMRVETDG